MTRPFNIHVQCANCGCMTTAETGFSRWIRERDDLDSRDAGIVCNDIDYVIHKYKTADDSRDLQLLMVVEVKTRGAEPGPTQKDTIGLLDQFLRNRRDTPTKITDRRRLESAPVKAFSLIGKREISVRAFGVFTLQFENTGPHDSGWIKWGPRRVEISEEQLAALLRFDLDPDTLEPIDLRRHHAPPELTLFRS